MWLDPKYKCHVTCWGPESRSLHVWWTSPDLSFLRAGAFVTAHLKGSRQRQRFLGSSPRCQGAGGVPLQGPFPALGHWHRGSAGPEAPASSGTNCFGYCFPKSRWFAVYLLVWLIGKQMLGHLSVFLEMAKWSWESGGISGISYFQSD